MANPVTSSAFVKFLTKELYDVSMDSVKFADRVSMVNRIYRVIGDSTRAWEEFMSQSQVPDIQRFSGRLTSLGITPGYSTKIEPGEFGGFVELQRKLLINEQYGTFKNVARELVESASRVREDNAVKLINNATSTAFDFMPNQEEGVSLANNSHTTKVTGVSTSSGFDNLSTSAMNEVSVAAARITLNKLKSPIGKRFGHRQRLGLLVPDSLEFKAMEITKTAKGLYTANGTINPLQGIAEVIVWSRMEDASTQNWALVDLNMMKRDCIWIDKIHMETEREFDFMTKATRQSIYDYYGYGFIDWRWIVFHNVG